jgi:hypothetical protein
MSNLTISDMVTRSAVNMPERFTSYTEFQLYMGNKNGKNVIDFTEKKLIKYALKCADAQQKLVLMALIRDYRAGAVAVAWRRGAPVPIRITKET